MEQTFNTRAIILSRHDFREDDSRIVVFSEDRGKLSLVVRGAKKIKSKLSGHIEPLTLSRLMVVKGRDFDYVGSAKGEDFFVDAREDLAKLAIAGRCLFLVDKMTREGEIDDQRDVFELLEGFLSGISRKDDKNYSIEDFSEKLADLTGFSLEELKEFCR